MLHRLAGCDSIVRLHAHRESPFDVRLIFPLYDCNLGAISKECPDEQACALVARNLLIAASHMARHDVLHRDIKPNNCLVRRQPFTVVLADFGAAIVLKVSTKVKKEIACTAGYEAPEVLQSREYGFPSDWWSIGVSVLETAIGVAPFGHGSPARLLECIYKTLVPGAETQQQVPFCNGKKCPGYIEQRNIYQHLLWSGGLKRLSPAFLKIVLPLLRIPEEDRAQPGALVETAYFEACAASKNARAASTAKP